MPVMTSAEGPHVENQSEEAESEEEFERLRQQTEAAAERILGLAHDETTPITDLESARSIAQKIKPYIDRVTALKRLLNPVHRIVKNRAQVNELQAEIVEDVAHVESISHDEPLEIEKPLLTELQTELAAVKKDRKIFVKKIDAEDEKVPKTGKKQRSGLLDLPLYERLERVFKDRYVGPDQLSGLMGVSFSPEELEQIYRPLAQVWSTLFENDELKPHVEKGRIKTLQNTFGDYALVLRVADFPQSQGSDTKVPCSIASIRQNFGSFFISASERSLWYSSCDFYVSGIEQTHWAFVDRQYLNCSFKKPGIRLLMYARANDLPAEQVCQKSALEEVYDRVMLTLSTKESFFDDCNSMTRTSYQQGRKGGVKQVFLYQKDGTLRISGNRGTPHWRPRRPRWPGVLPAVVFS